MKRLYILVLILCSTLSGCYIADEIFVNQEKELPPSLQEQSETSVTKWINTKLKDETYTPYGFSKIKIIKPKEIVEVENLEKQLKSTPEDSTKANEIRQKRKYLRDNNIESKITLDHIFTFAKDTNALTIFEIEYILNDTLAVQRINPKILLNLPYSYSSILPYYIKEYTIFAASSYSEGRKLSRSFFRFYKTKLEEFSDIDEKSAFLEHTLDMSIYVKEKGNFDQNYIKKELLTKHMLKNRPDIADYAGKRYSELYETRNNEDNSLIGYYFFHEFIGTFNSQTDTNVVLVEMNEYYQIGSVFQLDQPFNTYTN